MPGYTEVISRGAFLKTLQGRPDVQLLVNHEGLPLGRTTVPPGHPGHLELSEDDRVCASTPSWTAMIPMPKR